MSTTTSTTTWQVRVTREDGSWLAEVQGLAEGSATWARNLPTLDRSVREVIVLGADLPDEAMDTLDIAYEYRTGDPALDAAAADLRARRTDLAEAAAALTQDTAAHARALVEAGWSVRDVAALLGISPQRVSQMATQAPAQTA
jgi:hypothetical protein